MDDCPDCPPDCSELGNCGDGDLGYMGDYRAIPPSYIINGATGVEASILIIGFATIVAMATAQMDRYGYMSATSGSIGTEVSIFTLCVGLVLTFIQYAKA